MLDPASAAHRGATNAAIASSPVNVARAGLRVGLWCGA